ncbi:MAG: LPS export ABC transporter permease LptG [Kiloniellales bacterium]
MRMSTTLYAYFARQFLLWLIGMLGALLAITFVFDLVELTRRAQGKHAVDVSIVIQMALLRTPLLVEKVLPFAVLFGSLLSFWRLTRSNELAVARAAGISVWQFLLPAISIVVLVGAFQVTVINPLASVLVSRFERMESVYFKGRTNLLAIKPSGIWLRQGGEDGQAVIHARRVAKEEMRLDDVIVFLYQGSDQFVGRLDAANATLQDGYWQLRSAAFSEPQKPPQRIATYRLPTELTLERIQDSFASPETMSFWEIPAFIRSLEAAGFTAHRHRLHWHALLAMPALLCAMVLIAASFSLRPARRGGTVLLVIGGVGAGFMLYFLTNMVFALGLSASIPVVLAAWTPAGVSMLLGVTTLLHLEDG